MSRSCSRSLELVAAEQVGEELGHQRVVDDRQAFDRPDRAVEADQRRRSDRQDEVGAPHVDDRLQRGTECFVGFHWLRLSTRVRTLTNPEGRFLRPIRRFHPGPPAAGLLRSDLELHGEKLDNAVSFSSPAPSSSTTRSRRRSRAHRGLVANNPAYAFGVVGGPPLVLCAGTIAVMLAFIVFVAPRAVALGVSAHRAGLDRRRNARQHARSDAVRRCSRLPDDAVGDRQSRRHRSRVRNRCLRRHVGAAHCIVAEVLSRGCFGPSRTSDRAQLTARKTRNPWPGPAGATNGANPVELQTSASGRRESNPRSQLGKLMFCR